MGSMLEEYLSSLRGKQAAVLGIGVSNRPLIQLLLEAGISVTACDRKSREQFDGQLEELEAKGVRLCLGERYLDDLDRADVIFRTPGMRPDVPQLLRAAERGAVVTSEMEAFFQVCPSKILAVTGSDGKTTTTTIIAGLLEAAGYRTFLGGNIGNPLLARTGEMGEDDMVVVELSSFQLLTMTQSADIAVVTNLSPNHLDVHRDMEEYIQAKRNVFLHQSAGGRLVINGDNPITVSFASQARGEVIPFSRQKDLKHGVCLKDGAIWSHGRTVLPVSDIRVPGVHNVENYMAAIAAVDGLVPDGVILEYARTFNGVAHRIELVRVLDGVRYYNDSIASSPTRTIAGLRSFDQKVILIAGGYDKNIPYDELGPELVEKVKTLILAGATGPKIRAAALAAPGYTEGSPVIVGRETLPLAVETAREMAEPGDIVLLSPASASFDQYRNFEERGNAFKEIVQNF